MNGDQVAEDGEVPMRSDAAVEYALRSLASVQPPAGLETRVLHGVHRRLAERSAPRILPWRAFSLAGSMLALIAVVVAAGMHQAHRPVQGSAVRLGGQGIVSPQLPASGQAADVSRPGMDQLRTQPVALLRSGPVRERTAAARPRPGGEELSVDRVAVAPADTAENLPAPPLPLTEQERLLLRYIHRRDPQELATLSPAESTLHEQTERAAYDKFFAEPPLPPPPPETPTGDPEWQPAIR